MIRKDAHHGRDRWETHPTREGFAIKNSGSADRDVVVVATTDAVDLDREVVLPGGLDTSYLEQNRSIFKDHAYGVDDLVGRLRHIKPWPDPKSMRGLEVRFTVIDGPQGDKILGLFRSGDMGVSIGFEPLEYGPPTEEEQAKYPGAKTIIRSAKLLELSVTPFPCNPEARGRAASNAKGRTKSKQVRVLVVDSDVVVL